MKAHHASERQRLDERQKTRARAEAKQRADRLRGGVMGLWDRVTGKFGRVSKENETEAFAAFKRDRSQRDTLVADQLKERRALQREIVVVRHRHTSRVTELYRDLARQHPERETSRDNLRDSSRDARSSSRSERSPRASRVNDGARAPLGPELGE